MPQGCWISAVSHVLRSSRVRGADEWLRGLVTGGLAAKIGRMGLVYFADDRGPDSDRDV